MLRAVRAYALARRAAWLCPNTQLCAPVALQLAENPRAMQRHQRLPACCVHLGTLHTRKESFDGRDGLGLRARAVIHITLRPVLSIPRAAVAQAAASLRVDRLALERAALRHEPRLAATRAGAGRGAPPVQTE